MTLGAITDVVLSGSYKIATVTVTNLIGAVGQNYTIAPARAAFSTGFTAPAAATTVTIELLKIGDIYGGGKVAYIFVDGNTGYVAGQVHGLIAATEDQSAGIAWSNITSTAIGTTGTVIGTGQANTTAIVSQSGSTSGAAWLCNDLNEGGYQDWYLPSKDELAKLYAMKVAGFGNFASAFYWSSTEDTSSNFAWDQHFDSSGYQTAFLKSDTTVYVRAVRTF